VENSDSMIVGRTRYFRPVSIKHPRGFYGGPRFYEETDDPESGPLILKAVRKGWLPLWRAEELLDELERGR